MNRNPFAVLSEFRQAINNNEEALDAREWLRKFNRAYKDYYYLEHHKQFNVGLVVGLIASFGVLFTTEILINNAVIVLSLTTAAAPPIGLIAFAILLPIVLPFVIYAVAREQALSKHMDLVERIPDEQINRNVDRLVLAYRTTSAYLNNSGKATIEEWQQAISKIVANEKGEEDGFDTASVSNFFDMHEQFSPKRNNRSRANSHHRHSNNSSQLNSMIELEVVKKPVKQPVKTSELGHFSYRKRPTVTREKPKKSPDQLYYEAQLKKIEEQGKVLTRLLKNNQGTDYAKITVHGDTAQGLRDLWHSHRAKYDMAPFPSCNWQERMDNIKKKLSKVRENNPHLLPKNWEELYDVIQEEVAKYNVLVSDEKFVNLHTISTKADQVAFDGHSKGDINTTQVWGFM